MTTEKITTYKLDAASASLADFDHCTKPGDFIEVSLWHNGEGFNVDLISNGNQQFQMTWGQFNALKKLIKELDK
jgi:hypothetical protein